VADQEAILKEMYEGGRKATHFRVGSNRLRRSDGYEDSGSKGGPCRVTSSRPPIINLIKEAEAHHNVLWTEAEPMLFSKTSGTQRAINKINPYYKGQVYFHYLYNTARNALLSLCPQRETLLFRNEEDELLSGVTGSGRIGGNPQLAGRARGIVNHHIPRYLTCYHNQVATYETNCIEEIGGDQTG